jgi:fumarate hydratase subunit beta
MKGFFMPGNTFKKLQAPVQKGALGILVSGTPVLITGKLITGRDAAHKKMTDLLDRRECLPFSLNDQLLYHMGPCPAGPERAIGPCGPTTSGRMDAYTPMLLDRGLAGIIGKGILSSNVINSLVKHGAIYFAATGGAGALYMQCVRNVRVLAFPELGPEAVLELEVVDFPVIVAVDNNGTDLFRTGPLNWQSCV